ncbi:MAG: hypothetical protein C4576_24105 [Desulfobacteraceae bacterium]|nr:MAG: hypothetical protein C4576_24105 [Desulfobacteraceae bacterium]
MSSVHAQLAHLRKMRRRFTDLSISTPVPKSTLLWIFDFTRFFEEIDRRRKNGRSEKEWMASRRAG